MRDPTNPPDAPARPPSEAASVEQERMRLILENAREFAIFSTDLERRLTSWNPGAEEVIGYAESEVLGQPVDLLFTPEDRVRGQPEAEVREALLRGRANDERWHLRKDGTRFWANGAMMRMNDAAGDPVGFIKIMRDETDSLQTRIALEQSRQELLDALRETERARAEAESANAAKDHFLAVLSHELRTPLTPVLMAAHMLSRNPDMPESGRKALEMIERNVQIEAKFIDGLLDLTKISRGQFDIVRAEVDLHETIRRAVEVATDDGERKNQQVTVSLDATGHRVLGDATRLQQVFWNLLKNASKFTPDGGSVQVHSRNAPDRIIVEVTDSGIGFEPESIPLLFEPFSQASPEVSRRFGGLGLGLAIARATVAAHDGTLGARSDGRDRGATFTVELPLMASP